MHRGNVKKNLNLLQNSLLNFFLKKFLINYLNKSKYFGGGFPEAAQRRIFSRTRFPLLYPLFLE